MRKGKLNIRERIYLEDLKKAAKASIKTKLKNVLSLSNFLLHLREIAKFKHR